MGEAAYQRGSDAGRRWTDPSDGERRIVMPLEGWRAGLPSHKWRFAIVGLAPNGPASNPDAQAVFICVWVAGAPSAALFCQVEVSHFTDERLDLNGSQTALRLLLLRFAHLFPTPGSLAHRS